MKNFKKKIALLLVMAMVFSLSACSKSKNGIIASVEGEEISLDDFKEEYEITKKVRQEQFGEDILKKEIDGQVYEDILKEEVFDLLVDEIIISKDLERLEIGVTNKEVEDMDKELKELRINQLGGEEEYKKVAQSFGLSDGYIKKTVKRSLVLDKHIQNFLNKAHVPEDKIETFYQEHKDELEKRLVSHILLEEKQEGEELIKKLNKGADFHELAALESLDNDTVDLGGELGYVSRGDLSERGLKELEESAFKLKVGEISDLIESDIGYHIVYVEAEKKSLDDLRGDIVDILKYEMYIENVKELKENADIKIYEKEFK